MVTDQAELRQQSLKCARRRTWLGRVVSLQSITAWGSEVPVQRKEKMSFGWKHLPQSCQSNLQFHFQGRKKEKGPGQRQLSQNFSSGHLFMSHRPELQNTASPGCKRGWENKNWVGHLAILNKIREDWDKQEVDKAAGSGWSVAAPCRQAHALQVIFSCFLV